MTTTKQIRTIKNNNFNALIGAINVISESDCRCFKAWEETAKWFKKQQELNRVVLMSGILTKYFEEVRKLLFDTLREYEKERNESH